MARVLVVDDEQSERLFLEQILLRGGHDTFIASDGEQGYETYLENRIDVIVTDLYMPNVDGLEFIARLGGAFPNTPVIAVSGSGDGLLEAAKGMDTFAVLEKPVDPDELLATIAEALPES